MIEFVIYVILINVIFECLQLLCPMSRISGFIRSFLAIIIIYLICLKLKMFM